MMREKPQILVNNVGMIIPNQPFLGVPPEKIEATMKLNTYPQVLMTKRALKNEDSLAGIIHLSSIASDIGLAGSATYSATKRFNEIFALGTNERIKKIRANSIALKPGYVYTPMTKGLEKGRENWFCEV